MSNAKRPWRETLFLKIQQLKNIIKSRVHFCKNETLGGNSLLHGVNGSADEELFIPSSPQNGHVMLVGTTRSGKTGAFQKGDEDLINRICKAAVAAGPKDDFIFFGRPYPAHSATHNSSLVPRGLSHFIDLLKQIINKTKTK